MSSLTPPFINVNSFVMYCYVMSSLTPPFINVNSFVWCIVLWCQVSHHPSCQFFCDVLLCDVKSHATLHQCQFFCYVMSSCRPPFINVKSHNSICPQHGSIASQLPLTICIWVTNHVKFERQDWITSGPQPDKFHLESGPWPPGKRCFSLDSRFLFSIDLYRIILRQVWTLGSRHFRSLVWATSKTWPWRLSSAT